MKLEGYKLGRYIVGITLSVMLLLTGCSFGTSSDKELSKVLAEMNEAEEASHKAQEELNKLEETEQTIFNEMMDLTREDEEELKGNVSDVQESLNKRLAYIEEEEEAVKKAKESAKSLDSLADKVDDEAKSDVQKLRDQVNERYDFHAIFVEDYRKLAESQKKLYELLLDKEVDLKTLDKQVDEVNKQNDIVKSSIEKFNEATVSLNKLKDNTFTLLKNKD